VSARHRPRLTFGRRPVAAAGPDDHVALLDLAGVASPSLFPSPMNEISVRLRDVPFPEATVLPRREGLAANRGDV
jgi:hypothetical protein